jgi:phosphohistidine phosphatase
MKRIYLVRHATAQDKGEGLPDLERSLTKKGEKEAKVIARHLARRYAVPDLMISSFANRAIETAHLTAKAFGYPVQKILLRDTFYGTTAVDALAGEIVKQPDRYRSLMLFGHDPAFSRLAAHFIKGFRQEIPKAGVVAADFPAERWADLKGGTSRLIEFTSPALLKEEKKKLRGDLESRLVRSWDGILRRVDMAVAEDLKDDIRKSAQKISREFLKERKKSRRDRPAKGRSTDPAR